MNSATVRADRDGSVVRLTIDHVKRRNAMTLAMWNDLARHCTGIAAEPDVRAVILTGAGHQAFCAGADISQFGDKRSSEEDVRTYDEAVTAANRALANWKSRP